MKVSETHNLLACYPNVAKSIDFDATIKAWEKNPIKYAHVTCLEDCSKITPGTNKHAIFKCLKNPNHDNCDAIIRNRTKGHSCHQCAGQVASKENNLLTCYPDVAKSIDFNATIKAWEQNPKKYAHITCLEDCFKITPKTNKQAIFKCLKNPEHNNWNARIGHRTGRCHDCPQCINQIASKENNLLVCYPDVAKSIDFEKTFEAWKKFPNKYVNIACLKDCNKIMPKTNKRAIFKCLKNSKHDSWDAIINDRTGHCRNCPQCSGNVVSKENNLLVCYPDVAKSIDFEKTFEAWKKFPNKYAYIICLKDCIKITPSSGKRAIFKCLKNPKHDNWDAIISSRTILNSDCPQCAGAVVSKENNLLVCYPEIAKSIDFNATIKAWEQNPKKYVYVSCLADCNKIAKKTGKHAIFKCLKNPNHDNWDAVIHNRIYSIHSCPQCANSCISKEEKVFKNELVKILQLKSNEYKTNTRIIPNFKKNIKNKLELDFVCKKLGIAVEFNGTYWHSDKVIRKNRGVSADFYHHYKFEQAKKLGLTLLFVQEQDWLNNKEEVLTAIHNYCFKHIDEIPEILQLHA